MQAINASLQNIKTIGNKLLRNEIKQQIYQKKLKRDKIAFKVKTCRNDKSDHKINMIKSKNKQSPIEYEATDEKNATTP
jgi:hypothetical protein